MAKLQSLIAALLAGSSFLGVALAHPGEKHSAEEIKRSIEARDTAIAHSKRANAKCAASPQGRALRERAAVRRSMAAQLIREKRGIVDKPMIARRDQEHLDKWLNTCHDQGAEVDYEMATQESVIFTSNATTALTPETIIGPYFVEGELIRSNISEGQAGVPIHLDLQFIDIETCEPIPDMLIDVWHANATGSYSGVGGAGQGDLNTTFCRGVQVTDKDGVTQFDSVYPGHYIGRTLHIHVVSRRGGQILPNGTYTGGTVNHIGQLYFDQELNDVIEAMEPYISNTMARTTNVGDFLTADEATEDSDPFVDYIRLGDDANDGLLMWITIGVNTTADYNSLAYAAAHYGKNGGEAKNPFGGAGGMPPFPFPANFTGFPGGFPFPTGSGGPIPFPTGTGSPFPSGFPGGFPGFPIPGPQATAKPWGPCLRKTRPESTETKGDDKDE